jgi:two-component system sensor histidine kinase UhpB
MNKYILIVICLCCLTGTGNGQDKAVDSLLQVLKTSKEDTAKVNTLNKLAIIFRSNNPDTSIYYAGQAKALADKMDYRLGAADALVNAGIAFRNLGKYEEALKNCNAALTIYNQLLPVPAGSGETALKIKILKKIASTYNTIGIIYDGQSKWAQALKHYFSALKAAEELGDKRTIAATYNNIGIIYSEQGNYAEALKNILASLKLEEASGNKTGIANDYTNMGLTYESLGKYPEALKNHFAALKILEELGDKRGIAMAYNNIGEIFLDQRNYTEALNKYTASLKIAEEIGDDHQVGTSYSNIGEIYNEQGNYPEALKNFFAALKVSDAIGDKQGIAIAHGCIGTVYTKQQKYHEASQYLNKGLEVAKEIGDLKNVNQCYRGLAQLDSAQGNYKQSLEYFKLYIKTRDSLENLETTQKMTQIQMQYDFDKKESREKGEQEKKDVLALKQLQTQKLLRNFSLGIIVLLLVLSFLVYRGYRGRQLLRLNDIRNRIAGDLHDDIGSTLNSISIYSEVARKKDEHYDEALEMIGDASRKIIDAMSDIVWTINADNDSFEKIIFRMKSLAYNLFRAKNIEFTFHSDEILNEKKLSLEDRRNFYLIFKEAVNNLVKYSEATRASITLTYEDGRISLCIRDNGIGFDTSQYIAGNGLKSMKRRADEMKAEFKLESQKGSGTHIDLILKG